MRQALRMPFIVGTGSGGCRIVSRLMIANVSRIAVNSSWRDLEALPEGIVKVRAGDGSGSGMDPKKGEADYEEGGREGLHEALDGILEGAKLSEEDVDLIPVVVSAGFGFGSGSGPKIVSDLRRRFPKAAVIAWVTLPFYHEGEGVRRNALKCFKSIASEVAAVAIDNQHVANIIGKELSLRDIFNRINNRIAQSLLILLTAATSPNTLTTIDRSDIRKVLGKGAALMFTKSFNVGMKDFSELYNSDSCLSPYSPGWMPTKVKALSIIRSPKAPSPEELSKLTQQCEELLNVRLEMFKAVITAGGTHMQVSLLLGGLDY